MAESVTATEASRRFSNMLDRIRFGSESFDIVRNGEVVARIVPPERQRSSLANLVEALDAAGPMGADFADDLEAVKHDQPPLDDPWTS
jgi:antitoxin (DNA-binding transcriptional repressor) of toxin-antitoxin stability system